MSRLNSPTAWHRVPTKSSFLIPTRRKVELGQELSTFFPLKKGRNVGQFRPTWPKSNILGPCTVAQLLRPRRTCSREVPLPERLRQCPLLPHQHSSSFSPPTHDAQRCRADKYADTHGRSAVSNQDSRTSVSKAGDLTVWTSLRSGIVKCTSHIASVRRRNRSPTSTSYPCRIPGKIAKHKGPDE